MSKHHPDHVPNINQPGPVPKPRAVEMPLSKLVAEKIDSGLKFLWLYALKCLQSWQMKKVEENLGFSWILPTCHTIRSRCHPYEQRW
jgi:hypothetical protein